MRPMGLMGLPEELQELGGALALGQHHNLLKGGLAQMDYCWSHHLTRILRQSLQYIKLILSFKVYSRTNSPSL
jgi:hypothetical protein